jgi:hypothetical protein
MSDARCQTNVPRVLKTSNSGSRVQVYLGHPRILATSLPHPILPMATSTVYVTPVTRESKDTLTTNLDACLLIRAPGLHFYGAAEADVPALRQVVDSMVLEIPRLLCGPISMHVACRFRSRITGDYLKNKFAALHVDPSSTRDVESLCMLDSVSVSDSGITIPLPWDVLFPEGYVVPREGATLTFCSRHAIPFRMAFVDASPRDVRLWLEGPAVRAVPFCYIVEKEQDSGQEWVSKEDPSCFMTWVPQMMVACYSDVGTPQSAQVSYG